MLRIPGAPTLRERRQAQALVELALVSAVMLIVLFAVFEGVWWAYAQPTANARACRARNQTFKWTSVGAA